jgi:hypothetical protein
LSRRFGGIIDAVKIDDLEVQLQDPAENALQCGLIGDLATEDRPVLVGRHVELRKGCRETRAGHAADADLVHAPALGRGLSHLALRELRAVDELVI